MWTNESAMVKMRHPLGLWSTALAFSISFAACNDSSSLYGELSPPLVSTNESVSEGPFPGCTVATPLDTSRIQIAFAFPPNATKMNVYRNGIMIGSSATVSLTTLVDENLSEGHSYLYTCEALINGQYKMGTESIMASTLSVNSPKFAGIATASATSSSSVTVTWLPADTKAGVAPAYYLVYYNLGYQAAGVSQSKVNWSTTPKKRIPATLFRATIDGLGDELTYYFGVRACSSSDVCDTNILQQVVTLADSGAPTTPGLTGVTMVNGLASLSVPWDESNGAVSKRKVYQSLVGGTDFANYILVKSEAIAAPYNNPSTTLLVPGLSEGTTYYFIVRDEDPSGKTNTNTVVHSITTGDMTPPAFGGITLLANTDPKETALRVGWSATEYQDATHPDGAKQYLIYTTEAPYPYDVANGLIVPAVIPDPCSAADPVAALSAAGFALGDSMTHTLLDLKPRTSYWVCVKAQDQAGNISKTTNYYAAVSLDTTAPPFDGLQTIAFNNPLQKVDLTWNISDTSDLEKYRITLWKTPAGSTSSTVPVAIDAAATKGTNIGTYSFSSAEYAFEDGDRIYAQVAACDNAETLPGGTQNCSPVTAAKSLRIPNISPPKGFRGIAGLSSSSEGTLTVSWNAPETEGVDATTGTWKNYAGFRVYQVQNSSLVFMKDCPCPVGRCTNNPTPPLTSFTSCEVPGDVHRKYTIYVAAYDDYGNYTTSIPALAPGASTQAMAWTLDTTAPGFSSTTSQDTASDSSKFKLSWMPATDNQYAQEPLNTLTYRVYRKAGEFTKPQPWTSTTPHTPNIDADAVMVSGADPLSVTRFSEPYKINGVPNLIEETTYHWVVCAFDGSGNSMCTPNAQSYKIPDRTKPEVSSFNHTSPMPTWQISWNMKDNARTPPNLKAVIRLRKSTLNDTDFPQAAPLPLSDGDIEILNQPGSAATGTAPNPNFIAVNGSDPATNIYTLKNQAGEPGKTFYFNYAITIFDEFNSSTPLYTSVRSKLAPPLKAKDLQWSGKLLTNQATAQANWTKSQDPDFSSQELIPWFSLSAANRCSGTKGTAVTLTADDQTKAVPLSGGDGYYSFEIITTDTFGNTSSECSSNVVQLDRVAPTVTDVMVLGVGTTAPDNTKTYTTGNVFFLQMSFNKPILVTGAPGLKLAIPGSVPAAYFPGGGGAVGSNIPSATILFQYNVGAADSVPHLQYAASNALVLNVGDDIADQAGNAWDFNLPAATDATLASKQAIVIDTTTPSIEITSPTTSLTPDYINLDNAPATYTVSGTCSNDGLTIEVFKGGFKELETTCNGATVPPSWQATLSLAGLTAGPHPISAKITNLVGKSKDDTILLNAGRPSAIVAASGNNQQNITAGNPVLSPFVALVKDALGIVVPGVTVDWSIDTTVSPNDAVLAAPTSSVTNSAGKATSSGFTTGKTVGTNAVKATISGKSISTTFSVVTVPGAPAKLVFKTAPAATQTAGSNFSVVVEVQDSYGNAVTNNPPAVTLALQDNPHSGTLSGGGTVTPNTAGQASFSVSLNKKGAGYTLKASVAATLNIPAITTSAFEILGGAPAKITFSTPPPSGPIAGATFADVVVQVQDAYGNSVTNSTASVTLSYVPTGSGAGATLAGQVNAVSGAATFSGIKINTVAPAPYNSYTFTATAATITDPSTGNPATVSAVVTVQAGTPSQLIFKENIGGPFAAGQTISPAVVVQLLDQYNNLVTSATNSVTLSLVMSNQAAPTNGAALSGGGATAPNSGEVSFSALSVDKASGTQYKLKAAATVGATPITGFSSGFSVKAGAPDHIAITAHTLTSGSPPYVSADSPAFNVTVQIQDAANNVVTTESNAMMALQMNNAGGTTVWSTASQSSYSAGDFIFTGVSNTKSGTYTLVASTTLAGGGAMSSSPLTFKINAGAPKKLIFTQQPPSTLTAASQFTPIVEIRDQNDNAVLTATNTVVMAISQNPGGGTLSGTKTVSANGTSGTATFTGLSIDRAANGYQIQATSTGLTSATSNSFDVKSGPAAKLVFTSQPAAGANIVAAASNIAATVEVQDAGGNRVATGTGATHTIALHYKDPTTQNLVEITSTVASGGVATFSGATLTVAKDGYTLAATDESDTSILRADSNTFNIKPAAPVALALSSPSNALTLSSGLCFASAFTLSLKDAFGNDTTWQSSTISIPLFTTSKNGAGSAVFSASNTCSPALSKVGANHVAQFTNGAATSKFYMKYGANGAPQTGELIKITADGSGGAGLTKQESPEYTVVRRVVYYAATTEQSFTVPADSTQLIVKAWGAGGAGDDCTMGIASVSKGGAGAFVHASFPVNPGSVYRVTVSPGGRFGNNTYAVSGGYSGVFTTSTRTAHVLAAGGGPTDGSGRAGGGGGAVAADNTSTGQMSSPYNILLSGNPISILYTGGTESGPGYMNAPGHPQHGTVSADCNSYMQTGTCSFSDTATHFGFCSKIGCGTGSYTGAGGYYGGDGGWGGGAGGSSHYEGTWIASEGGNRTTPGGTSDPDYQIYGAPIGAATGGGSVAVTNCQGGDGLVVIYY